METIQSEFQAVILAGGMGNNLYPLTEGIPKHLLPVGNRPVLSFQLEMLEKTGFAEALVVTTAPIAEKVTKFCREIYKGRIKINLVTLDNFTGTADALRQVAGQIKTDFFLISGDVITNVFLHYLADVHRSRNSAVTMMLQETKIEKKKSKKLDDKIGRVHVGLAMQDGVAQVTMYKSMLDVEEDQHFKISKTVLRSHQKMRYSTKYRDQHIYLFSHWVLDVLEEKPAISSVQGELIPYLVRAQFSTAVTHLYQKSRFEQAISTSLTMSHSSYAQKFNQAVANGDNPIKCFAYLASPSVLCVRTNTVASYMEANQVLATADYPYMPWTPLYNDRKSIMEVNPKYKIGQSCVINKGLELGKTSVLKKSVVGEHCKIGDNSAISNSVLMDHVIVDKDCEITNSIICPGARILSGAILTNCRVGPDFTVTAGLYEKEALIKDRNLF
jgi:translation initiation factor eIF-2B subunit gamma